MDKKRSFVYRPLLIFLIFVFVFSSTLLFFVLFTNKDFKDQKPQKQEEEETSKTEQKKLPVVIIDAGHGGEDGGTIGVNGCYEKDINLKIAKKLEILLGNAGIQTVMTRSEDILLYDRNVDYKGKKKILDLAARLKISEQYENAIFVSIHMNSFPEAKYNGLQVYYSPNDKRSVLLADKIQLMTKELLMPENSRKTKTSGGKIYLLDQIALPAVLIECGFLSNPEECKKLCDETYQKELCEVICRAICEHLNEFYEQY